MNFPLLSGEWNNSGRKRRWQSTSSCLPDYIESFWKRPGKGKASFRLHSSSESFMWNKMETQPRCCVLGTIGRSAGSSIRILAKEIIRDHDILHDSRRLHWSCDCSRLRSSNFRTACDTEARTQGHVEAERAKPAAATAAAAAAAHFPHRRTWDPIPESNMGKQGGDARRLKTHHRSGATQQATGAYQAIERINIGSNKIYIREDLPKKKMVFSQESSQAIFDMGNVELIELKTSMIRCPSCPHKVFKRDNYLPMREAHQTRPGYDATNQSCFWSPEGAMLSHVFD